MCLVLLILVYKEYKIDTKYMYVARLQARFPHAQQSQDLRGEYHCVQTKRMTRSQRKSEGIRDSLCTMGPSKSKRAFPHVRKRKIQFAKEENGDRKYSIVYRVSHPIMQRGFSEKF